MDALSEALAGSGNSADSGLFETDFRARRCGYWKDGFAKSPVLSHSNRNGH